MPRTVEFARFCYILARAVVHVPIWLLLFIAPSRRPCPRWPFGRAVLLRFFHYIYTHGLEAGHLDIFVPLPHQELDQLAAPSNLGKPSLRPDGAVVVPPAPQDKIGKELASLAARNSVTLGEPVLGFWHGPRATDSAGSAASKDERVILNIHGGAWISETAGPNAILTRWVNRICAKSPYVKRAFMPEYRLSARVTATHGPRNAFPAALVDCLAGYIYLLGLGFKPAHIILTGDSAGANTALALAHHLFTVGLPLPGRIVLLSPAVDCALSHSGPISTAVLHATTDFALPFFKSNICIDALRGQMFSRAEAASDMWISPGGRDVSTVQQRGWFAGLRQTRTLILAGGAECSLDGQRTLRDRIRADLGKDREESLVWHEEPDATHNWVNLDFWQPEAERGLDLIVEFIA